MFKLVIQDDEGKTTVVPLIRDEITIGRKEGNTIRLTERNVSRRHAKIVRSNGEVHIEDLGSYNGIRVNNARIAERVSLRISDQVQIGDYKLYLKAEGVEQVDDARTMPIERIENGKATEVMAAVTAPAPAAPTAQLPATPMPASASGTGQNRAITGVADTDPAGRPVATAAQVAALTQPVGYGKLAVLSSNFAGKEFDLTRPQMIVGRTDENDIVVNHRSISRNHAKITRDPETGRYTISDLQSSNGVRVNGQDYGKVELRRGDVVDLGHVRLRFVEPGEDFVFSRDAVITDVPETGGKKGMLVAILLAIVVLGGIGAFFAMKGGDKDSAKHGDNGSQVASDSHNQVASGNENTNPGGSNTPGSNVAAVEMPADAAPTAHNPPDDEAGRIRSECLEFKANKKWGDLSACANRLAQFDKQQSKELGDWAAAQQKFELAFDDVKEAASEGNLGKTHKLLDKIGDDSPYKSMANDAYAAAEKKAIDQFKGEANQFKRAKNCAAIDKLIQQAQTQSPAVVEAVRPFKCEAVATTDHPGGTDHHNPTNGSGTVVAPPPPATCDADALQQKGEDQNSLGQYAAALFAFEQALKCKADPHLVELAFMASCNAKNTGRAKVYFGRLSAAKQGKLAQICIRNGILLDQLQK